MDKYVKVSLPIPRTAEGCEGERVMTNDEISAIEKRREAATEHGIKVRKTSIERYSLIEWGETHNGWCEHSQQLPTPMAVFVATAATDIPALCKALREAREGKERWAKLWNEAATERDELKRQVEWLLKYIKLAHPFTDVSGYARGYLNEALKEDKTPAIQVTKKSQHGRYT